MNTKRYADYLQEEATGDFSSLEIATGPRPFSDSFGGRP